MKNYQKSLISVLLFFAILFGTYFLLSLMGMMFGNTYQESAGCIGWFFIYCMVGIPFAGVISQEAYEEL
jgi:hypothetical protein